MLLDWFHQQSWIELIGVITGLLCVYLAAVNNIWNWPLAIISVTLYIFIFFEARLYADMGLQFYFLGANIYGWYFWSHRKAPEVKVPVVSITTKQIIWTVIAIAIITPSLGYTLIALAPKLHYKPAAYPYLDSFCTAVSLIAQFFMARKIYQNWLMWVFVDIIYVGVYIVKHLQPTAFMYAVYAIIALVGYLDWRKEYRKQGA
ncbi:nicotinamide riboside transporter PnuC [Mucilaginibacter agri]|uniref:Nicotinamide riboside transporter PnuC n=1 Tax=Mucilaginibacter agri TaxID=2695265 RepID=A0A965ZFU9_9SPHI|nr:nicotinamide riboside transporter PnuC [Mucilaginibacter agri]NCD70278.1 nicotinamide riboside transporter PnuC [Mucilaginibacter agri]